MYKKITIFLSIFVLLYASASFACVGRTLYIGALETTEDTIMAEMLALLINERTGTTVQTRFFKDNEELYTALKSPKEEERVDILVEDTIDAITIMKQQAQGDPEKDYQLVKDVYDQELMVVWLSPFGYNKKGHKSISAPLVRRDVLTNFPLLPRVLNKLAGTINDKSYNALNAKVAAGEKPKNAAKNFLKKKKFI